MRTLLEKTIIILQIDIAEYQFMSDDLFADVDAENISKSIGQESSLEDGLNTYFCSGYKKRFNEFTIDFLSKKTFTKWVDIYTKERFIFNKWPLYVDPDKNKVPIPKELSEAARDVFVEYIWERVDE